MDQPSVLPDPQQLSVLKTNAFNDTYVYELNRHTFDKAAAEVLFATRFKDRFDQPHTLTIVIGTDSGLLPGYLLNKGIPNGSRFIFIEPAAVLEQLQRHGLLNFADPAIVCITPEQWETAVQDFKIQDYFYINAVQSLNAFCAEDDYLGIYAELSWHTTEVLSQYHWNYGMALGTETFTTRQIFNVADNLLPAKLLDKAFAGRTAVLLAGGPSLDAALPWVSEHRRQLVVFAVSRISRQLKQLNLEPDFIFSVDPTELSFDISKEMLEFSEQPVFIHSYHTIPALVNQWEGLKFYLGPRVPWESALNVDNFASTGPTVTNTALNMAQCMGFTRIILAGVDLCFTRDGYTHAKGSDEQLAGPRFNLTSLQAETNDGSMAPTSCDFAAAINTLALQARLITATGTEIINVSGRAAKVPGITYQPLADVILDDTELSVRTVVAKRLTESAKAVDYGMVLGELKRANFQILAIKRLAETAWKINQSMYTPMGLIGNYKDKRQLDKIEKKLRRDYRAMSKLVKRFGVRNFIKITQPFSDREWSAAEAQEIGNTYYEAYRNGAAKLAGLLADSIERVESRLAEQRPSPDFSALFRQWRKDKSYGRAGLWQKQHPQTVISEETAQGLAELHEQFTQLLQNKNTRHLARAKSHTSLGLLKKRAALLFKHQKTEALQDLLTGLAQHQEQASAAPYAALINGYLAELQHDPDTALMAYQAIIDLPDAPLLEEALLRITAISIERQNVDDNDTYLALQCLAQLSPLYLPFYAEICRLRGDSSGAIQAYHDYLAQFPTDHLHQLKLAALYLESHAPDAAQVMIDYLLAKNPADQSALHLQRQLLEGANSG